MKLSTFFMPTFKETPKDAVIKSHILMLRASLISKHGSGIYTYLPLGHMVMEKLKTLLAQSIVEHTQAQELAMPHLLMADLWKETGRYDKMGEVVFKLNDRHQMPYVLGPTHEETIVQLLRGNVKSYKQFPLNFFQIERKFRDEIRPRYGVMRGREFTMLDGYSFHMDEESLALTYQQYKKAYLAFYKKVELHVEPVLADSGDMGGAISEEFMVQSSIGDDLILKCDECGTVSNQEKSKVFFESIKEEVSHSMEDVETPHQKSMEDLKKFFNLPLINMVKTIVFKSYSGKIIMACIRGDRDINEAKLVSYLEEKIELAPDNMIEKFIGKVGFLGPIGMKNPDEVALIVDFNLVDRKNLIVGSNKENIHLKGVSFNDFPPHTQVIDLSAAQDKDICGVCKKGHLVLNRGIEVGHIFQLGSFYTRSMQFNVISLNGKTINPLMGCYGLGVDRTFAAIIEQHHDENGIIFPYSIAPFQIIILVLDLDLLSDSFNLYSSLKEEGYEVLIDDRILNVGVKFKDADLIGIPIRLTIGKSYKEKGYIGFKLRGEKEEVGVEKESIVDYVNQKVKELY